MSRSLARSTPIVATSAHGATVTDSDAELEEGLDVMEESIAAATA